MVGQSEATYMQVNYQFGFEILINSKKNSVYNVGGSEQISILNLAKKIANLINPKLSIIMNDSNNYSNTSNRYIPNIDLIKKELNLTPKIILNNL